MDDRELIRIGMFKLAETGRRMVVLAELAESPSLRQLLTALSSTLDQQEHELRSCLMGEGEPPVQRRSAARS